MLKLTNIIFIVLLSVQFSCRRDERHPVPAVATDLTIDINLPSYNALTGVGGWTYVTGGSRGIVVYRRAIDDFVAFDRHSPADPNGTCNLPLYTSEDNFLVLIDSCNNAQFSLYDGSPIANSKFGLRMFQTVYNGSNLLRIFN